MSDSSPFLLVRGSVNKTVDPAQSTRFKGAMERALAHKGHETENSCLKIGYSQSPSTQL
jgi:hypothetical protein